MKELSNASKSTNIGNLMIQVLSEAVEPMHVNEIAERVTTLRGGITTNPGTVSAYLTSIRPYMDCVKKTNRGFYKYKKNKIFTHHSRIGKNKIEQKKIEKNSKRHTDLATLDIVLLVLKDAGLPLHQKDITYRANRDYGYDSIRWDAQHALSTTFNTLHKDKFVNCGRLGEGFWGLVSRDSKMTLKKDKNMRLEWDNQKSIVKEWFEKRKDKKLARILNESSMIGNNSIETISDGNDHVQAINNQNKVLKQDIEKYLNEMKWDEFEKLVSILFKKMGYNITNLSMGGNDRSIDVRCEVNKGFAPVKYAIQVKRWIRNVRSPDVDRTRGGLRTGEAGIIVTTSGFSPGARENAMSIDKVPISLIDGEQLIDMLIEHRVCVKILTEIYEFSPVEEIESLNFDD